MRIKSGLVIITIGGVVIQSAWNDFRIYQDMSAPATLSCAQLHAQKEPVRFVKVSDCVVYHGSFQKSSTSLKIKGANVGEVHARVSLPVFLSKQDAADTAVKAKMILVSDNPEVVKSTEANLTHYNELIKRQDQLASEFNDPKTSSDKKLQLRNENKSLVTQLQALDATFYDVRPMTLKWVPGEDFTKLDRVVPEQYSVYEESSTDDIPSMWKSVSLLVAGAVGVLFGLVWFFL